MSRLVSNNFAEIDTDFLALDFGDFEKEPSYVSSDKIGALWLWVMANFMQTETELRTLVENMRALDRDIQEMKKELTYL